MNERSNSHDLCYRRDFLWVCVWREQGQSCEGRRGFKRGKNRCFFFSTKRSLLNKLYHYMNQTPALTILSSLIASAWEFHPRTTRRFPILFASCKKSFLLSHAIFTYHPMALKQMHQSTIIAEREKWHHFKELMTHDMIKFLSIG